MTSATDAPNRRVLIIDDNESVHDDLRKILLPHDDDATLRALSATLLGRDEETPEHVQYEIDCAGQGHDGLALVETARRDERPYALAFVDMRMPPGWDGVETIERIWAVDPDIEIVICTAFSDLSPEEIKRRLGLTDQLLILKKPFEPCEASQIAYALTEKWNLRREARRHTGELEALVDRRAAELKQSNEKLASANTELAEMLESLRATNERLEYEVAERQRAEGRLRHDAFHDVLTDLPNRALMMERLHRCIERSKRDPDYLYSVLFLDLDNFKVVNDSLGHKAGDELLAGVARRLCMSLRALDTAARPSDDTTARFGGDEFVILLDGVKDRDNAGHVAERIIEAFQTPFDVLGHEVVTAASIGVATSETGYDDPDQILRDADTALYRAKEMGKGCFAIFDVEMRERAVARLQIEHDLRKAIERHQLRLHFQPMIALGTGAIVGFEALVRWAHPERGLMSPAEFVPTAEEAGLIVEVDEWVLRESLRQLALWHDRFPDRRDLSMSVNLASREFAQHDLPERVIEAAARARVDPGCVKLEITETVVMENSKTIAAAMGRLRTAGVQLFMDDFGTGYSSLRYLHELPIDALKIDRTFTRRTQLNRDAAATIQAMVTLAHNQGIIVIAEGVENINQLALLQTLECDLAQGYFFAPGLDVANAERLLETGGEWNDCLRRGRHLNLESIDPPIEAAEG